MTKEDGNHTMEGTTSCSPLPSPSSSFDPIALLPLNNQSPAPQPDRRTTNDVLHALLGGSLRPAPCDVYGPGPLLLSDIPADVVVVGKNDDNNNNNNNNNNDDDDDNGRSSSSRRGVIMGIDEAGRGPVLGPMTYAAAFWNPESADRHDDIPSGFDDSKQLSPEKRAVLFEKIKGSKSIGFVLRVLHASEISRNMLRDAPYNLNAMSHDAAMEMVWAVLDAGVKIDTCYIDTVGNEDAYRKKLERVFEGRGIKFVVEKKADAKYAPCSAASVVAKESRDTMIANWKWTETPDYEPRCADEFGSGYPGDPRCKAWLDENRNVDAPFGFPDLVRFSWGPAKNALKEGAVNSGPVVGWEADEEDEDDNGGRQASLDSFVVGKKKTKKVAGKGRYGGSLEELRRKRARTGIFNELGLSRVTKFAEAAF